MTPGQLIKKYRHKKGMTQLELAKKLGYGIPQFVALVESGRSKFPLSKLPDLAKAFELNEREKDKFRNAFVSLYVQAVEDAFRN